MRYLNLGAVCAPPPDAGKRPPLCQNHPCMLDLGEDAPKKDYRARPPPVDFMQSGKMIVMMDLLQAVKRGGSERFVLISNFTTTVTMREMEPTTNRQRAPSNTLRYRVARRPAMSLVGATVTLHAANSTPRGCSDDRVLLVRRPLSHAPVCRCGQLDLFGKVLDQHKMSWVRLDGSANAAKRQQIVDNFNADSSCFAFLLSSKARPLPTVTHPYLSSPPRRVRYHTASSRY